MPMATGPKQTVSMSAEMFPEKDYKTTWAYDNLNRVTTISQTKQSGGHAVADKTVKYTYNGRNQVTDINRYANLTGTGAALRSVLGYDNAGRLTSLDHQDVASGGGATLLHGYDFTWDNASRITGIDSSLDGISSFTLDKLGQLKTADHAAGRTDESYTFDSTGNRTGGDYTVTTRNRTTASTGYAYQYDKEGTILASVELEFDAHSALAHAEAALQLNSIQGQRNYSPGSIKRRIPLVRSWTLHSFE